MAGSHLDSIIYCRTQQLYTDLKLYRLSESFHLSENSYGSENIWNFVRVARMCIRSKLKRQPRFSSATASTISVRVHSIVFRSRSYL
ncbi:hypothetical protein PENTCL1PPCAC_21371, partial [Pristionchus entomophagus]